MKRETPNVSLVTGGASGIGLLLARDLASRGSQVAVIDVNEAALNDLAESDENITVYCRDLSDQPAIEAVVSQITEDLGDIDCLMHCAAIMPGGSLNTMDTALINKVMCVNYMGTVNITQSVLSRMREKNHGEIVVIGSMAGEVPAPGMGAYCASKSATNTYVEMLHHENLDNDVYILLVCPPGVDTPLITQALEDGPPALAKAHLNNQLATPESIVAAIDSAMKKRQWITCPGGAGFLMLLRRLFPGLVWWMMNKANASTQ